MDREAFWKAAHHRNDGYWLSGTQPGMIVNYYDELLPTNRVVTEIGVGLGNITRELRAKNNVVTAVDIVPEALAHVQGACDLALLVRDLPRAPSAEWALCHLVFQHCEPEMVRFILAKTPLAPGGSFLFQTAYPLSTHISVGDAGRVERGELVFHTGTDVKAWAEAGGLDVYWSKAMLFNGESIGWTLFKARRRA